MPISGAVSRPPRRRWRAYVWRGAVLAVVFGCGVAGFASGLELSDRPGITDAGWLTILYYNLGLFVLGGLDLGVPVGGPAWGRTLLWIAYFGAPLITASAVVEGVLRAVGSSQWRLRRLRGHIVVGGCGRLAMLYLRRLREEGSQASAVIVESRRDHPYAEAARDSYRAMLVRGDISTHATLNSVRLDTASRVLLMTGDDFANLDAAAKILASDHPRHPDVIVHVSDLQLIRQLRHTRVFRECTVFNSYQIAASHLVQNHMLGHLRRTSHRDVVVLAGFGRFGQTMLDELQRAAPDGLELAIVIDLDARPRALVFDEHVGFNQRYRHEAIDGDISDLDVWNRLDTEHDIGSRCPVFVLGSGDDASNLRTALLLTRRYPDALVVARTFFRSSFVDEVSKDAGFEAFSVAQLVTDSMPAEWFGSDALTSRPPSVTPRAEAGRISSFFPIE